MMEFSIVTISAFVATLNEITKFIFKNVFDKDVKKFIPLFSIIYGIILGVCGYYSHLSDFGDTIFEAVFIGISSGAAATGFHQVGKQLSKTDECTEEVVEITDDDNEDIID